MNPTTTGESRERRRLVQRRLVQKQREARQASRLPYPLILVAGLALLAFASGAPVTIGGVPPAIVVEALQDSKTRSALLARDNQKLHDRLKEMGVEERVNEFYRDRLPDSKARDLHVHQTFYNLTGYVGTNYETTASGNLIHKEDVERFSSQETWKER